MTTEQKAKAYDEAIKRAKQFSEHPLLEDSANIVEYIFPELKESEDERIRKKLIFDFQVLGKTEWGDLKVKDILAWLEKQGEQKPNPYSGTSFEYNGHTWGMCARDNGVEILIDGHLDRVFTIDSNAKEMFIKALERVEEQNAKGYKLTDCDKNSWWEDFKAYTYCTIEQKTADNIEPKFKIGDWVIDKQGIVHQIANVIENVTYHTYGYDIVGGGYFNDNTEGVRLWTIQDAKDGDVLQLGEVTAIFKKYIGQEKCICYCSVCEGEFEIPIENGEDNVYGCTNTTPATKEQRDTLFVKIKEAGYEWNAELKKVSKITTPADVGFEELGKAWAEEANKQNLANSAKTCKKSQRMVSAEAKEALYDKPAWSEEDEDTYNRVYCLFRDANDAWYKAIFSGCYPKITRDKVLTILKSLKPQPKQIWSEEDEEMLDGIILRCEKYGHQEQINWLKSLKERYTWKPSDAQIASITCAVRKMKESACYDSELVHLLQDLKKLKGE